MYGSWVHDCSLLSSKIYATSPTIQYVTKLTHKITLLTIFSFSTSTPGPSRSSRSNGGTPFLSWPTSRIYLVICGKFLKPLKVLALSTCHVSLSFCLMLIYVRHCNFHQYVDAFSSGQQSSLWLRLASQAFSP